MSTFLLSLGVVAAAIAAVLHVALNGPDQPPTIRRQPSREGRGGREIRAGRRSSLAAAAAATPLPLARPAGSALSLPDSDPMHVRVLPAVPTTIWVRIRSGVALVVLVAVLGALLAMVVGGLLVAAALAIRSATG